jgi:hypothetical protein
MKYFGDIGIAAPRLFKDGEKVTTPKEISEKIDQVLRGLLPVGGKIGATVRVFQPTLNMKKTNGREAVAMLVCRCEVNPILNTSANGTNKNVTDIGYQVLRAGQGFTLMQGFCSLYADGECFLPYVSQDRQFATVDILLQANIAVSPMDAVIQPTFATDGNGLVTLTNVTPNADIWYSLDACIFPAPQIAQAKPYTGPFTVDAGTDVRFAAYRADKEAGSCAGFQTINY